MRITNTDDYFVHPTIDRRRNVAVLPFSGEPGDEPYHAFVVQGLAGHPSVAALRTNWKIGRTDSDFVPEALISVTPVAKYSGSWVNALITWPGFILGTPSWLGYKYSVDVDTSVRFLDLTTGKVIDTLMVETDYGVRFTDNGDRGILPSFPLGWFVFGSVSFLSAPFMTSYDTDATKPFQRQIASSYGRYIAENIIRRLVAGGKGNRAEAKP